jgi:hypothetical protein
MRNRAFGILNIVVMVFYLIRPSLPYFEYILNKKYIEKYLCVEKDNPGNCCHGKCYLHMQLEKQNVPMDADTNNNKKAVHENRLDDHLRGSLTLPGIYGNETDLSGCLTVSDLVSFSSDIFVPPKY